MRTLLLFLVMMPSLLSAQSLSEMLQRHLQKLPAAARVSLAVESLTDTTAFYRDADKRLPSASLIKLPIMVEAMYAAQDGRLNPDEIYILLDSDKVGGTGILKTYQHRSRIAYRDLIALMMTLSDNTATNILLRELDLKSVNGRMQSLGLKQTELNRIMMDTVAVKQGVENFVSARDLNLLLRKIYRKEVVSPAYSEQMIDILKRCEDTTTIPRLLPKSVEVAHKTGTLAYVRGDAGIVYARKPFLLSVLVQGVPTEEAERVIAGIAAECFAFFNR